MSNAPLFQQDINIGLGHSDAAGVIFAPRLLELAHGVYENFLDLHGWPIRRILDEGWALPIVHMEADFLLPLKVGDRVDVALSLEQLQDNRFTLVCEFRKNGECAARTRTVHVAVADGLNRPLPDGLHQLLASA